MDNICKILMISYLLDTHLQFFALFASCHSVRSRTSLFYNSLNTITVNAYSHTIKYVCCISIDLLNADLYNVYVDCGCILSSLRRDEFCKPNTQI